MKKRILTGVLIVVIISLAVLVGRISAGNLFRTVPADFTVVPGIVFVEVFSDPACSQVLTTLQFGEIRQAERASMDIYLKNMALMPTPVFVVYNQLTPWGTAAVNPYHWDELQPGEVVKCTITIAVNPKAALGNYELKLEVSDGGLQYLGLDP